MQRYGEAAQGTLVKSRGFTRLTGRPAELLVCEQLVKPAPLLESEVTRRAAPKKSSTATSAGRGLLSLMGLASSPAAPSQHGG